MSSTCCACAAGGVWYTDANGLEWQQRRLGYRPAYTFKDTSMPANIYPMTTGRDLTWCLRTEAQGLSRTPAHSLTSFLTFLHHHGACQSASSALCQHVCCFRCGAVWQCCCMAKALLHKLAGYHLSLPREALAGVKVDPPMFKSLPVHRNILQVPCCVSLAGRQPPSRCTCQPTGLKASYPCRTAYWTYCCTGD
jgi:hypothetical protein